MGKIILRPTYLSPDVGSTCAWLSMLFSRDMYMRIYTYMHINCLGHIVLLYIYANPVGVSVICPVLLRNQLYQGEKDIESNEKGRQIMGIWMEKARYY